MLFVFFMFLHPLEKELPVNPLHPPEISGFKALPLGISIDIPVGGGGGGGYGYFLEPHNKDKIIFVPSYVFVRSFLLLRRFGKEACKFEPLKG